MNLLSFGLSQWAWSAGLKRQNNHTNSDSVFIFRAESVNHINKSWEDKGPRVTPNLGQKCKEEQLARKMMISCTGTGPNLHLRKRRLEVSFFLWKIIYEIQGRELFSGMRSSNVIININIDQCLANNAHTTEPDLIQAQSGEKGTYEI